MGWDRMGWEGEVEGSYLGLSPISTSASISILVTLIRLHVGFHLLRVLVCRMRSSEGVDQGILLEAQQGEAAAWVESEVDGRRRVMAGVPQDNNRTTGDAQVTFTRRRLCRPTAPVFAVRWSTHAHSPRPTRQSRPALTILYCTDASRRCYLRCMYQLIGKA